jgi:TRAP-type C4-dicarboxylate transport system permease small subunit
LRRAGGRGRQEEQQHEELRLHVLEKLAKFCAILAGVLLTGITLMTCGSLIGRNTVGVSLVGDFELTGVAAGAAIALFMPWCQIRRGNIIVDFFTAKASERTNALLDRFGALLLAGMMGLLAWRTVYGGLNAWSTRSGTMMLGFPEWIVYSAMIPPLVLTAVIGLHQAFRGFGEVRE